MEAFSYLSVLLSIIIGLALTQVLQGYRGLLLARSRVRLYAPTLIWSALLLVFATQSWWASFGLSDHEGWTFAGFSTLLLQTVLLYMMTALVLPDIPADAPVDLQAHYYRERKPFFGLLVAMLVISILKDWVLDGRLPEPENMGFHALFAALGVGAILTSHRRYHEMVTFAVALLINAYIAKLFWTLS